MGIFSGSQEKDKLAAVFDIGSSSVGGALFWMQKSGVPKIVFSVREPIILEEKFKVDRFLSLAVKSLEIVLDKVSKAGLGAPAEVFCVLSSPYHTSQIRIIRFKKNTPFTFTSSLADDLIQKESSLFEKEHLVEYADAGGKVRVIELKNIKTMLNGYATSKPLNQKAKELEMTIFISISPEQILEKIEEVMHQHFNFRNIKFFSILLASFTVVRDLFIDQKNFLLIDIGGEMTDISMIKKNVLQESVSFPTGQNFIIRGIAAALGCTIDEAKSFIFIQKDRHASAPTSKKLEPIINKLKTEWLLKFQESLATLSNDISIPSVVFVTVDPDLAGFFSRIIEAEQFSQYILTEAKFKVVFLGTEALHGIAVFEENIIRDPFLVIESVYINRLLH